MFERTYTVEVGPLQEVFHLHASLVLPLANCLVHCSILHNLPIPGFGFGGGQGSFSENSAYHEESEDQVPARRHRMSSFS
jgi:hypothetical protein